MLAKGCKVRVRNPNHWLADKVGYVGEVTLDNNVVRMLLGGPAVDSVGVPVDFGKRLSGCMQTAFGKRKVRTHTCHGAFKGPTGYYLLLRELEILDVATKGDSVGIVTASR